MFMGDNVPAVGISIGVDRLLVGMNELGMVAAESMAVDMEVLAMDEAALDTAFRVAEGARAAGLRCEVYPLFRRKLKAQLSFAAKRGVRYCAIVGQEEVDTGTAILRDMEDGSQNRVKVSEITGVLRGDHG
jgi:histidyl-tRNA synthetase